MNIQEPSFESGIRATALLCPVCNGANLHHETINTYWRDYEDAESGVHSECNDGHTDVNKDMSKNPSPRRDGLFIDMSCEDCGELPFALAIYQHKGTTFVSWVNVSQPAGW
jgi:hypothetical protein